MDEINEQTENMKQIQEALSAPIGAAADFDEVIVLLMPFQFLLGPIQLPTEEKTFSSLNYQLIELCEALLESLNVFSLCRMNWKLNSKSWKVLSWKNSFFSLQQLLLQLQCRSQQVHNVALLQSVLLRKMNWLHCRLRWHFKQVPFLCCDMIYPFYQCIFEFSYKTIYHLQLIP